MKRTITTMLLLGTFALAAEAQTLHVVVGRVTYDFPASQTGTMTYQDGTALTIMGKTFQVADITRMYVDQQDVTDNSITVSYQGEEASVTVAGNVARYVTPTVSGAHVSLEQSDEVGEATCGEITYALSGASTDGSFAMTGSTRLRSSSTALHSPTPRPQSTYRTASVSASA